MSQNDVWALIAMILMIPMILDMNLIPNLTLHPVDLGLGLEVQSLSKNSILKTLTQMPLALI